MVPYSLSSHHEGGGQHVTRNTPRKLFFRAEIKQYQLADRLMLTRGAQTVRKYCLRWQQCNPYHRGITPSYPPHPRHADETETGVQREFEDGVSLSLETHGC